MAHLTCFAGGMIALGAQNDPSIDSGEKERQMTVILYLLSNLELI